MFRAVLAVLVGFFAVGLIVPVVMLAAYSAMGAERAFRAASYDVSPAMAVTWFVVYLAGTLAAGIVCAMIARPGSYAPVVLAGVVLVLGLASATLGAGRPDPGAREPGTPWRTAMQDARQPAWALFSTPFVGAFGVVIGGKLTGRARTKADPAPPPTGVESDA
ncbi:MAG: hypothetical protein ACF8Q5_01655 [Phycisphaerales bacterium JB040]